MTYSKTHPPNNKIIIGYTTTDHLLLDLDNTSYNKALKLVFILVKNYPELGDALIMHSSTSEEEENIHIDRHGIPHWNRTKQSFHIITDNVIGYNRCKQIMNDLIDLQIAHPKNRRIRAFRGDMTLRVSPMILTKKTKASPTLAAYIFNQICEYHDGKIREYLAFWTAVTRLFALDNDAETCPYNERYCAYHTCRR